MSAATPPGNKFDYIRKERDEALAKESEAYLRQKQERESMWRKRAVREERLVKKYAPIIAPVLSELRTAAYPGEELRYDNYDWFIGSVRGMKKVSVSPCLKRMELL